MPEDIKTMRNDFPQLADTGYHFLDSAASSLVPQSVLDAMNEYYVHDKSNVHRGFYPEALRATAAYETARGDIATFINAFADEIIFTAGATEASNMLVRSLEATLTLNEGDEILTTVMEHHATLVPLQQLAKRKKLILKHIPMQGTSLDYAEAQKLITPRTKIVSVMLVSNVTGTINDIAQIADMAHAVGATVVVDATAGVGHIPCDVRALHADALYFSGHKMLGPTGVGVLWVKHDLITKLEPSVFGGHMIDEVTLQTATWAPAPTKFESGTKNIGGVIGLGAAVKYLTAIGVKNIHTHTQTLVQYALQELNTIPGLQIVAEEDIAKNAGIVSFTSDIVHPHDIAEILARDHVAVRPGHHCAMPLHTALGTKSTIRASFHLYNTPPDVDALVRGITKAQEIFK